MRRRLLICIAAGAGLLGMAVAALGVRSLTHLDCISRGTDEGYWNVQSLRGRLLFQRRVIVGDDPPPKVFECIFARCSDAASDDLPWRLFTDDVEPAARTIEFCGAVFGAAVANDEPARAYDPLTVGVPHWMVAAATWLVCAGAVRRLRRRPPGMCRGCGYDLRASIGRCPECGKVFAVSV